MLDGSRVTGIIVESKSGRQAIAADVVIDATGDGDMAARAGAPFMGPAQQGDRMNMSFMYRLGGLPASIEGNYGGIRIGDRVVIHDRVPPSGVPIFVTLADVLASPRLTGTNTPLKIYSFLKSGKPLVATNLYMHTQVLDDRIAVLVEPTPEAMAEGLSFALTSPEAQRRAGAAKELAEREYTYSAYKEKMDRCLRTARGNFVR
jgi:hypothetical protein